MKKLLLFALLASSLVSLGQSPQSTGDILVFIPVSAQRVHSSDSVQIYATLTSNSTVYNIAWSQTAGPTTTYKDSTTYYGNATATSSFWLHGLTAGSYAFKATGKSITGATATATVNLIVVPDIICPPIPTPRTVVNFTITINGQSYTISSLSGTKFTFSDGSTQ